MMSLVERKMRTRVVLSDDDGPLGQAPRTAQQRHPDLRVMSYQPSMSSAKAASEAARYTALCNDLDDIMESVNIRAADISDIKASSTSCVILIATVHNGARFTTN